MHKIWIRQVLKMWITGVSFWLVIANLFTHAFNLAHFFRWLGARYDEGVFVGQQMAGSSLHVDQVQWSNVGKNWTGWKLLAVWPYGAPSADVLRQHFDEVFFPPLRPDQVRALHSAAKLVLVAPGDVYVFSGACAHTSLCVGESLSLSAYESFVNCNAEHVSVFMHTAKPPHFKDCWIDSRDWKDIREEVADHVDDTLRHYAIPSTNSVCVKRALLQGTQSEPLSGPQSKDLEVTNTHDTQQQPIPTQTKRRRVMRQDEQDKFRIVVRELVREDSTFAEFKKYAYPSAPSLVEKSNGGSVSSLTELGEVRYLDTVDTQTRASEDSKV